MRRTVVIAGASGVVGAAAVEHFSGGDWDVVAVSRRRPDVEADRFTHLSVDLTDAAATAEALGGLRNATHLIYAALFEKPGLVAGWREHDQMQTNLTMLRNCVEPLCAGDGLRHVTLLQGTKAYGSHLHDIPVPARESLPRDAHENFYWLQEDYLRERSAEAGFAMTIMRPQLIVGPATGVAMNVVPVIGAYASICRELGRDCGFPGGPPIIWEAIDARLLAQCFEWAGSAAQAHGETYNITNGDVFSWHHLWPAMMATLGVRPGEPAPVSMVEFLAANAGVWDRLVDRHGLRRLDMRQLIGQAHYAADYMFALGQAAPRTKLVSTVKLRKAGFCGVVDTQETFAWALSTLMERKVLPPADAAAV